MKLDTEKFDGAVILKHWMPDPITGRKVMGVAGQVSIAAAEDAVGFVPATSESNWIARVQGPTTSYTFPGCQVASVVERHGNPIEPAAASDILKAD